jgi:hypothetical protein
MKKNKLIISIISISLVAGIFFVFSTNFALADPTAGSAEGGIDVLGGGTDTTVTPPTTTATTTNSSSGTGSGYNNQEKIPGFGQTSDFPTYMKQIVNFLFATIGILAMFMLMIGAYQYLMTAGNIAKEENAKTTISSAISGLILGLIAYLLLYTINPDLVAFKLDSVTGGLTGTSGSPSAGTGTGGGTGTPSNLANVKCETVKNYTGFMNKNTSDLNSENINSAQDMQNALTAFRKNNNGLTQYSDLIYQTCKTNNVPGWYMIGTFAKESSMNSDNGCAKYNNPGCMMKDGQYIRYATPEEGIKANIENMGRRLKEYPTPLGAWNAWYWPDRPGNCAGAQEYLDFFSIAAQKTGLSGI